MITQGADIRRLQQALEHTNINTTANAYAITLFYSFDSAFQAKGIAKTGTNRVGN
jgi:site-specific recombinase XerD